jgi:hypothetical protein
VLCTAGPCEQHEAAVLLGMADVVQLVAAMWLHGTCMLCVGMLYKCQDGAPVAVAVAASVG